MRIFTAPMIGSSKRFLVALLLLLLGCDARTSLQSQQAQGTHRQRVTQVSILSALMLGAYDGMVPIRELLREGDFGVGTCDHLDGELIVLDGKAFQAKADGSVVEVSRDATTPFAVVTQFDATGEVKCADIGTLEELEAHLNATLARANLFYAVRLEGDFDSITLRSVARQEPPYQPLVEVSKQQSVWHRENMRGTLVAFRSPKWVGTLGVPGYHWHFVSDDRKVGGHVLNCKLRSGTARYDECGSWLVKLDNTTSWEGKDVEADLSKEVEQVERMRK